MPRPPANLSGASAPAASEDRHVNPTPRPRPPRIAAGSQPPKKLGVGPNRSDAQIALLPANSRQPSIATLARLVAFVSRPADSDPTIALTPPMLNAPAVWRIVQCQIVVANSGAA